MPKLHHQKNGSFFDTKHRFLSKNKGLKQTTIFELYSICERREIQLTLHFFGVEERTSFLRHVQTY
jgi:hypothetical protein